MEHHLLVRFFGDRVINPGALSMGFTRGRRMQPFGMHELRIAEVVLPALHGAVERITMTRLRPQLELLVSHVAADRGLSRAETRVLSVLLLGCSNRDIARRLCLSIDTVKTHLSRIFRKLGVVSRAQAIAALREGWITAR
jgi:DNA-binding NarL/FixJ family response regulator